MGDLTSPDIREAVRERYAATARRSAEGEGCCGADPGTSCCGPADIATEPGGRFAIIRARRPAGP